MAKYFSLTPINSKKVILNYIGKQNEDLATWVYLEIPARYIRKGVKIQQAVMMDVFEDQANIVNLIQGEKKQSFLFDKENQIKVIE